MYTVYIPYILITPPRSHAAVYAEMKKQYFKATPIIFFFQVARTACWLGAVQHGSDARQTAERKKEGKNSICHGGRNMERRNCGEQLRSDKNHQDVQITQGQPACWVQADGRNSRKKLNERERLKESGPRKERWFNKAPTLQRKIEAEEGRRTDASFKKKTVVSADGGETGEVGSAMTAAIHAPRQPLCSSSIPQWWNITAK